MCNPIEESQINYAKWKKADAQDYIYDKGCLANWGKEVISTDSKAFVLLSFNKSLNQFSAVSLWAGLQEPALGQLHSL